jgi:hypothetical protein
MIHITRPGATAQGQAAGTNDYTNGADLLVGHRPLPRKSGADQQAAVRI